MPHHPVHMNIGEPADLGEIGLVDAEREAATIAEPGRDEPRIGFAQKVRDTPEGIRATKTKQLRAMDRCVDKRCKPACALAATLLHIPARVGMGQQGRHEWPEQRAPIIF